MIKIGDLEFNGEAYITCDSKGTWIWEVKPVLEVVDDIEQWVLPEEYRDKPGMTLLMNQVNGMTLPILLNMFNKNFNDNFKIFDKPRIFKINLSDDQE